MEKVIRKIWLFLFLWFGVVFAQTQYSGYVYYVKDNNIWVNDLSTNTSTKLTILETAIGAGTIANPFVSPDGAKIVFAYKANTSSETILYSVNTDGSGLENLSSIYGLLSQTKNQSSGIFSPDMNKLAFVAEMRNPGPVTGSQLWLKELTGLKRLFMLTFMNGDCSDPQFVDDTHIVFKHKFGYLEDYYIISTDGSDLTNLTNNAPLEPYFPRLGRPSLNQNRSTIYYARQDQDVSGYSNWKVYSLNIQTGSSILMIQNLYYTENPLNQRDPQPVAISDTSQTDTAIVFCGKSPFTQQQAIYLSMLGETNPYGMFLSDTQSASYPLFYPVKGNPSMFVYTTGSPSQVFLRDSSGQTRQLTSTINNNYDPVFDSTGSLIAYAGNGIWVMKADGTNPVQIETTFNARYPAFSPDSKWVAYIISNDIYARKRDLSSSSIRLTNTPNIEKTDLCFSPSGTSIVYTGSTSSGRQIFSLPVSITDSSISVVGSSVNLSQSPGSENYHPCFSPDGTKIVFVSTRTGSPVIFAMNPDGSGQYNLSLPFAWVVSYPQFSPWETENKIAFVAGSSVSVADMSDGTITQLSGINPAGKFSWAKNVPYRISVNRQFVYNRIDKNLAYYYCLVIDLNEINPPSSFIITEELPVNWQITGAWFNNTPLSPLTSSGNTTGIVKWIVSNNIGSIFPLIDGTLLLKIEFTGSPVIGTWNYIGGNVTDGQIRKMTTGNSYVIYGNPDFPADFDGDSEISDYELLETIDLWASNSKINGWPINTGMWDYWLLKAIDFWARGGYAYAPTASEPSWNSI